MQPRLLAQVPSDAVRREDAIGTVSVIVGQTRHFEVRPESSGASAQRSTVVQFRKELFAFLCSNYAAVMR